MSGEIWKAYRNGNLTLAQRITVALEHFAIHNSGKLPAVIRVNRKMRKRRSRRSRRWGWGWRSQPTAVRCRVRYGWRSVPSRVLHPRQRPFLRVRRTWKMATCRQVVDMLGHFVSGLSNGRDG